MAPQGILRRRDTRFYRQLAGFMPWAAFWQLDRKRSNPTPSHAGPSVLAATPTLLRGTQRIDTAVYSSLTSCHSALGHIW
jgi:hypothetical protein